MKVSVVDTVKIHDGAEISIMPVNSISELDHLECIEVAGLMPIQDYDWNGSGLSLETITKSIGGNVLNFNGVKIYQGSTRGASLYVYRGEHKLYILSYGETQSARYQLALEAIVG